MVQIAMGLVRLIGVEINITTEPHTAVCGNNPKQWVGSQHLLNVAQETTVIRGGSIIFINLHTRPHHLIFRCSLLLTVLDRSVRICSQAAMEEEEPCQWNTEKDCEEPCKENYEVPLEIVQLLEASHEFWKHEHNEPNERAVSVEKRQEKVLGIVEANSVVEPWTEMVHLENAMTRFTVVVSPVRLVDVAVGTHAVVPISLALKSVLVIECRVIPDIFELMNICTMAAFSSHFHRVQGRRGDGVASQQI